VGELIEGWKRSLAEMMRGASDAGSDDNGVKIDGIKVQVGVVKDASQRGGIPEERHSEGYDAGGLARNIVSQHVAMSGIHGAVAELVARKEERGGVAVSITGSMNVSCFLTAKAEGILGPKHGIQTWLPIWEYVSRVM
jgi:hypothetical protein